MKVRKVKFPLIHSSLKQIKPMEPVGPGLVFGTSVESDMRFYAIDMVPQRLCRTTMKSGRFQAVLKRAPLLKDNGHSHQLPPGQSVPVYPVDMFPGCPAEWVREPGSYICPVEPNWGLWFDWTDNDHLNTAILPSVKGMNPITGRKIEGLFLEQYKDMCPVHAQKFEGDLRMCPECGYQWPAQSYVCSPNTLWWDGFRQPDGTVRQFFFTEDEERDIAQLVIGQENTTPAFGFAFFEPKTRRELPPSRGILRSSSAGPTKSKSLGNPKWYYEPSTTTKGSSGGGTYTTSTSGELFDTLYEVYEKGPITQEFIMDVFSSVDAPGASDEEPVSVYYSNSGVMTEDCYMPPDSLTEEDTRLGFDSEEECASDVLRERKTVAVGAGAKIRQDLAHDPLAVTEWKEEASGVIRLYFVFKNQFKDIVSKGINDVTGHSEGYLKNLPVG